MIKRRDDALDDVVDVGEIAAMIAEIENIDRDYFVTIKK